MVCYYGQYHSETTISWISPIVNSSDSALRATTGQEGWGRFCHVVYPLGFAFSYDPTRRESRGTSDPVLSRDQGNRLQFHP